MTSISKFDLNVYSEETFTVTESEYDEVTQASAVDDGWQGYTEWSEALEQGQIIDTPSGQILINRECSHNDCLTTRCEKAESFGGIAI